MNRSRWFTPASVWTTLLVLMLTLASVSPGSASPLGGVPFNNTLQLDGTNDYATLPDHANLDLGVGAAEDFTIETFFFVPNLANTTPDTLVWKDNAYGLYILFFTNRSDIIAFRINTGPSSSNQVSLLFGVDLTPGWHHIAAVFDNEFSAAEDRLVLYLNGIQVKTQGGFEVTPGINNSAAPVILGAYQSIATLDYFGGRMDEVRLSNVMRYTGSYTVPTAAFANDASTRALWHFNEAAGATTFSDSSGKGNTLSGLNGAKTSAAALSPIAVSGSVGIGQTVLSYADGGPKTTTTLPNGSYSFTVPNNWSGTVTPSHVCYNFAPASRSYANVTVNQTPRDYTPSLKPGSPCADIDITTRANPRGRFGLPPGASTRVSFAGLSEGSVELLSRSTVSFIAAKRLLYKVNGVNVSFAEMMAMPHSQLDTIYWLPWYNNTGDLNTQLVFGNTSNVTAVVRVYIAGQEVNGSPFNLESFASARLNLPGVNNGPVRIVSSSAIVVSEQVIYRVNGVNTSFTEMMGLPNSDLNNTYWLPWYNNVELDTQLRIANVSNATATVHVTIGGVEVTGSPFTLAAGASARKSFPGVNNGPVKIQSNQNIVAAERVVYKVNGINTSFTEMMALPNSQLNTIYWLPWYNNTGDLDTQLRIANVSASPATVRIFIGGVEMAGSPFTLAVGASARKSFPGINNGPVKIQSNQNIVAAERVIFKVNGAGTSFTEMMGLPNNQLYIIYWLPHYDNVGLDTQLRFGVP